MKKNFIPIISIITGFIMIIVSILLDGSLSSFWSVSSLVITILGSLCALLISYPLKYILGIPKILIQILKAPTNERGDLVTLFCELSRIARKEGLLSLEDKISAMEDDFIIRGLQMVVDGVEPDVIQEILELEIETTQRRHKMGQSLFMSWGELAPAFGMIGTLIGLILMLSDLQDASAIGVGMATALITTFYGALFANLVLIPIANNLKSQSEDEIFTREMVIEGILAIQSGINPRIVEEKLLTYLSLDERMKQKSKATGSVMDYE